MSEVGKHHYMANMSNVNSSMDKVGLYTNTTQNSIVFNKNSKIASIRTGSKGSTSNGKTPCVSNESDRLHYYDPSSDGHSQNN